MNQLRNQYYNSSRGDKFYTWGSSYYYKTESEMDSFIKSEKGYDRSRHSHYIAEIGKENKNENFEHLIIVTDGRVDYDDIDESDRKVHQYGLKYSFVSNYIIGSDGDESVGCSYSRECPGITYMIKDNGGEIKHYSLSRSSKGFK